jgi:quinol monooxygenase YgiN
MSQQVTVIARLVAKDGLEARAKTELFKMVKETHKEPGCINYDLHVSKDDPRVFVFYENWETQAALDSHNKTPHFMHLGAVKSELFSEVDVKLFELISEAKPAAV